MTEWNPNGDDDRPVPPVDPAVQARFDERVARRASQAPETEGERLEVAPADLEALRRGAAALRASGDTLHGDCLGALLSALSAPYPRTPSHPAPERERVAEALRDFAYQAVLAGRASTALPPGNVAAILANDEAVDAFLALTGATLTREER